MRTAFRSRRAELWNTEARTSYGCSEEQDQFDSLSAWHLLWCMFWSGFEDSGPGACSTLLDSPHRGPRVWMDTPGPDRTGRLHRSRCRIGRVGESAELVNTSCTGRCSDRIVDCRISRSQRDGARRALDQARRTYFVDDTGALPMWALHPFSLVACPDRTVPIL
nr:hypothetical protein CFP56_56948 [Quercus suber]